MNRQTSMGLIGNRWIVGAARRHGGEGRGRLRVHPQTPFVPVLKKTEAFLYIQVSLPSWCAISIRETRLNISRRRD
jgi:hypothetical protein